MTESAAATSSSTRKYNGWRTSTMVLGLLCLALGVGWILRERQLRIDHNQERQDYEIRIGALQKEVDARGAAASEDDDAALPSTRPS